MSECSMSDLSEDLEDKFEKLSNKSQKTELNQVCVTLNSLVFDDSDDENNTAEHQKVFDKDGHQIKDWNKNLSTDG